MFTVIASTTYPGNSAPFGGVDSWKPYFFGHYKNIPASILYAGDIISFDLMMSGQYVPAFNSIALAGSGSQQFVTIVSNSKVLLQFFEVC
jgi:hypothetical protein